MARRYHGYFGNCRDSSLNRDTCEEPDKCGKITILIRGLTLAIPLPREILRRFSSSYHVEKHYPCLSIPCPKD
jgi:hypothetical protein